LKILNVHTRIISQPKAVISELFETLSSKNDQVWPTEKWPPMKFKEGLKIGSKGGHGPIRYTILTYKPEEPIQFEFTSPKGFNGRHWFEIIELKQHKTKLKHTIDINVSGKGLFTWFFAIRWLHDALVEDAFDKVENHFLEGKKSTEWSIWVKILRSILKTT